jgi:hypothetical protein
MEDVLAAGALGGGGAWCQLRRRLASIT